MGKKSVTRALSAAICAGMLFTTAACGQTATVSKEETAAIETTPEPVPVAETAAEALKDFEAEITEKGFSYYNVAHQYKNDEDIVDAGRALNEDETITVYYYYLKDEEATSTKVDNLLENFAPETITRYSDNVIETFLGETHYLLSVDGNAIYFVLAPADSNIEQLAAIVGANLG